MDYLDPDDLEESIPTPPESPVLPEAPEMIQEDVRDDPIIDVPCFDCRGQRSGSGGLFLPSQSGYLVDGILARILDDVDPCPALFQEQSFFLYGHHYITGTALAEKQNHLFSVTRQKILHINQQMAKSQNWIVNETAMRMASRDVSVFFMYITVSLHRYLDVSPLEGFEPLDSELQDQYKSEVVRNLISNLEELILLIERLSNFNPISVHQYATASQQVFKHHYLFHMKLDLHALVLMTLQCLHRKCSGTNWESSVLLMLNQQIQAILEDLAYLASLRLKKYKVDVIHTLLCPCACLQEMWCLMINIINAAANDQSFWDSLQVVLSDVIDKKLHFTTSAVQPLEEPYREWHPYLLSLWLYEQLAPLFKISRYGNMQDNISPLPSHWPAVQLVFKKVFSQQAPSEADLQVYLRFILSLSGVWGSHVKFLVFLWGEFSKRINVSPQFAVVGFQGLNSASKSASLWYDSCRQRAENHKQSSLQEDSFNLFVRIVARQLSRLDGQERQQTWKQLQGRLFSSFHESFFRSLNNDGLVRVISLFVTLMIVQGVQGLIGRILDNLDHIIRVSLTTEKKLIVTRGLLVIAFVHQENSFDFAGIADRLVQGFNKCCQRFKQENLEMSDRSEVWSLICNYVSNVQDLIESSRWLNLSQHKLIGQGFSFLLPACTDSELPRMLMFIKSVIQHFRDVYNRPVTDGSPEIPDLDDLHRKHAAITKSLWSNIYPFIEACACRATAPPMVAEVAASFTQLAIDLESRPMKDLSQYPNAASLFEYYALGKSRVHHSISSGYLCLLLPIPAVTVHLNATLGTNWQLSVVQTWFCCSLSQPNQTSQQLSQLTQSVFKHPQMAQILHSLKQTEPNQDKPPTLLDFIQACAAFVSSAESYEVASKRRNIVRQLFGDLTTTVKQLIRGQRSSAEYLWLYEVIGKTFKHCTSIIYKKVPGLLTELILFPSLYNQEKPIPQLQLQALRENLPAFIEGLASLNLSTDVMMRKKLRDIVVKYFMRLQQQTLSLMRRESSEVIPIHPLQKVLYKSCAKEPSAQFINLREHVLTFLGESFLSSPSQGMSAELQAVVRFLQELLQRTQSGNQIVRDCLVLLKPVLQYLLLADQNTKHFVAPLLALLMEGSKKCQPMDYKEKELLACFQSFFKNYIAQHSRGVFKVLERAAMKHPELMSQMIPEISNWIETGRYDVILRKGYTGFLRHLGERGNAEMLRMNKGDPS